MAKDPAFLFYPGDFNTGTQFFTDEQVGKYIRLLMAQHQHGHLNDNHVLHICKTYDKDVMAKFCKDKEGLWFNERLENEILKRKEYSISRSKNRSSKNDISKTYVKHMENENRNKDYNTIKELSVFIALAYKKKYNRDEGGEIGQDIDYMSERLLKTMTIEHAMDQIRNHKLYTGIEKLTLPSKIETIQAALLETDWVQRMKEKTSEEVTQSQITNEQARNKHRNRSGFTETIAPAYNGRIDTE